jgi:hypothetical protein
MGIGGMDGMTTIAAIIIITTATTAGVMIIAVGIAGKTPDLT